MCEELGDIGFERVAAVDGATIPEGTKSLTRFELACLASHQQIWRHMLDGPDPQVCVLEDDLYLSRGFGELLREAGWIPPDAHAVKLDTYFQKVILGEARKAPGGLAMARLYSRHESSAAYILTREGAKRYLELTAKPSLPADYALFPKNPRRFGLVVYQITPAVALQDHLRAADEGGKTFATAVRPGPKSRRSLSRRLSRESARLVEHLSDLRETAYLKGAVRTRSTVVGVE